MDYKISTNNGVMTVAFEGQINFASNEDFNTLLERILAEKPKSVTFNLANLTMIDSVGLGLLYIAHEDLSNIGAKLTLASPRNSVDKLLKLTEAHRTFEIIP